MTSEHPSRTAVTARARAVAGIALLGAALLGCTTAPTPTAAIPPELPVDPPRVETLAAPGPHWVWVNTMLAPTSRLFDADTGQMLGMISLSNSTSAIEIAPVRREVLNAGAYYSRGTYGDRTDVVQVRSLETLLPVGDVVLPEGPPKLANGYPLRAYSGLLDGERFMGVYNFSPAMSVSIVDVPARRYVGEIQTAGCGLVLPVAADAFLQLCGDGSVQRVKLDAEGNEAERTSTPAFFDANNDPLMDRPARDGERWWFHTMSGKVYSVSGGTLAVSSPFAVQGSGEDGWRPGGRMPLTYHRASGRLFVLMHEGGVDTHEQDGTEVWVFDARAQKRIARIPLDVHTNSIAVSQDGAPLLYALESESNNLAVYDANTGKAQRTILTAAFGASVIQPMDEGR